MGDESAFVKYLDKILNKADLLDKTYISLRFWVKSDFLDLTLYIINNRYHTNITLKKLEKQQASYIKSLWNKATSLIKYQVLQNEARRIPSYYDYEKMEEYPIIGAALDIFMEECTQANEKGNVLNIYSESERVRKELETRYGKDPVMQMYRDYRNGLNNCLNYQLQSLAAAVVNRAAIQINRKLKELGVDGRVQAQVHDQLIINVPEDKAKELAPIIQEIMENTTKLEGVTLKAPPEISLNWRDGH